MSRLAIQSWRVAGAETGVTQAAMQVGIGVGLSGKT